MHLGIDPGTRNLGLAVTNDDGKLICSCVMDMNSLGGLEAIVERVDSYIHNLEIQIQTVYIERFVAYAGRHSAATEGILMLIGALKYYFHTQRHTCVLLRAIDWKSKLCKYLFKTKGFNNPSQSFDKIYSKAAAKCITGVNVATDHEADAICLSYIWKIP